MEIERKYLLSEVPFGTDALEDYQKYEIEQSYISTDPTIRLRRMNGDYILTVKGDGLMSREEFELALTSQQYEKLLAKAETEVLCKTRYKIPIGGGMTAELDIYHKNLSPLLTVEVEFESAEQSDNFVPPDWFGKEVTFDPKYKNGYLVKYGLKEHVK